MANTDTRPPFLNIQIKEDSEEKTAAIAGQQAKFFLLASEFNLTVEKINELWELLKPTPFGILRFKGKGITDGVPNESLEPEPNDWFEGQPNANEYWNAAKYLGGEGGLQNLENYQRISWVEIDNE